MRPDRDCRGADWYWQAACKAEDVPTRALACGFETANATTKDSPTARTVLVCTDPVSAAVRDRLVDAAVSGAIPTPLGPPADEDDADLLGAILDDDGVEKVEPFLDEHVAEIAGLLGGEDAEAENA